MKFVIVIGDGMADRPLKELSDRTPLQYAQTPFLDEFAPFCEVGLLQTIPNGIAPGSDTANLCILGYDPQRYYTGRSPLEAVSLGIPLTETDVALRCNLATLSEEEPFTRRTMQSHSGSQITQEEALELMKTVQKELNSPLFSFHIGTAYRHLMVYHGHDLEPSKLQLCPPHDILGQKITTHLPKGQLSEALQTLMEKSAGLLKNHPINEKRRQKGLKPANTLWFWGQGKKPALIPITEQYHLKGSVISAVPLIHGIGILAGLKPVTVPGATGELHTNYEGKVEATLQALKNGDDFALLHVEAPDECGHEGDIKGKVLSIEYLDKRVLAPLKAGLDALEEPYRMLILPDHATPICTRTHAEEPVPYCLYDTAIQRYNASQRYDEMSAEQTGLIEKEGCRMLSRFLSV